MDRWLNEGRDEEFAGRQQWSSGAMEWVGVDVLVHTCKDRTSPFVG